MDWLIRRLKEPSSWRGICILASIGGVAISPELQDQIMVAGAAVIAVIEVIRKEKKPAEAA